MTRNQLSLIIFSSLRDDERSLGVPLRIDAIKKQLMRQKLIEFSSFGVKRVSSALNNAAALSSG
jgi:hypothetical protein